ncbi:hypothetical protein DFJ73DRAFT_809742 [Zopfochytrium polystomum]|nr:hypothetical protein DFJ73DRAFT_809742 [Zopfochytrium polystomum]
MFKRDDAVPLVTLDDETLLKAEREIRKTHSKSVAGVVGGGFRTLYSPLAVIGIAKAGIKGHKSFWTHEDVLAEVKRRGLTPLPKGVDEHMGVLVAGQVVATVAGKTLGDSLASTVVEPTVSVAASALTSETVTHVVNYVAKKVTGDIVEEAVATTVNNTIDSLPAGSAEKPDGPSDASKANNSPKSRKPILGFIRKPRTGPATATSHLAGVWGGFGRELEWAAANGGSAEQKQAVASDQAETADEDVIDPDARKDLMETLSPESAPKGEFKECGKYLMRFDLLFDETRISGKNLLDPDAVISGTARADGQEITFTETNEGVEVTYRAKVAGGKMQGTWTSSDKRRGTFKLAHL